MITETHCFTCGTYGSVRSNGDSAICTECGDTEGYIHYEDYEDQLWEKVIQGKITTKKQAREYRL